MRAAASWDCFVCLAEEVEYMYELDDASIPSYSIITISSGYYFWMVSCIC